MCSRVLAPLIFKWKWLVNFTRRSLCPEKNPHYPLDRGLVGPRAGLDLLERRKSLALTGLRTLHCSARSLITVRTEIYRYYREVWWCYLTVCWGLRKYGTNVFSLMLIYWKYGRLGGHKCQYGLYGRQNNHPLCRNLIRISGLFSSLFMSKPCVRNW